ncbi:hypothetical protein C7B77_00620 [Chamaesiphon polymorphus CCALA 037]|uniref:Uncharacterized protein n=2 Tax=Chamaesiphon TaxID=217161 RepID=A0A2T1GNN3_9CYAN|nr:hypothetical protein C7B77_00620 [Chamaesiphon polymorphus CCALA 037]
MARRGCKEWLNNSYDDTNYDVIDLVGQRMPKSMRRATLRCLEIARSRSIYMALNVVQKSLHLSAENVAFDRENEV